MSTSYIDSHQHFWQISRGDYDWLTKELSLIYQDFLPEDLCPLLMAARVKKTVVVQAATTVMETDFLLSLAQNTDFIAAVVGWIDMDAKNAVDVLISLADKPCLKGIRPMIQDIADPQWMLKPELDDVFQCLIEKNLSFDALVKPEHLPYLLILKQRYPELKTVIDHGAKPDIANQAFDGWARGISSIAEQTNARCKLSGLLTEARQDADYETLAPYMRHLLDCFGPARLMWGSDWPVLNLAGSYSSWLAITERFLDGLDESDKTQIMAATATHFYQLS